MITTFSHLVDGWNFKIESGIKKIKEIPNDAQHLECESYECIRSTLECFKNLFRVTTVGIARRPIIPNNLIEHDFIKGSYEEKPIDNNDLISQLQEIYNKQQFKDHPRVVHFEFYGFGRLWIMNNENKMIEGWFGRTSKENQWPGNFPEDILTLQYFLQFRETPIFHEILVKTYSNVWYETIKRMKRTQNDLLSAQRNKEALISCLKRLYTRYPNTKVTKFDSEEIWMGKDNIPFP